MSQSQSPSKTVRDVLGGMAGYFRARGVETARLDAEILLAHALQVRRMDLYITMERPVSPSELDAVRPLMVSRGEGKPVAQLTGTKEFYSLSLRVNEHVLVPRPETEILVDEALARIQHLPGPIFVLDLGTGSGCIGIALSSQCERCRVVGVDISLDALKIARQNVRDHDLEARVHLVASRSLTAFSPERLRGKVDLLVSNPPYVGDDDLDAVDDSVRRYEPRGAWAAGPDGYIYYKQLAEIAKIVLSKRGEILVEVGHKMASRVGEIFVARGSLGPPQITKDLAGIPRVVRSARDSS